MNYHLSEAQRGNLPVQGQRGQAQANVIVDEEGVEHQMLNQTMTSMFLVFGSRYVFTHEN